MAALEHSKLGSKVKSYVHVLSNWLIRANRFDLREVVLAATGPPPQNLWRLKIVSWLAGAHVVVALQPGPAGVGRGGLA